MGLSAAPQDAMQEVIASYRAGHFDYAKTRLAPLLSQYPQDAFLHNVASVVYLQSGEPGESVRLARQAITILPSYSDALTNLGAGLLALALPDEAIVPLRKALDLNSNDLIALLNLARSLIDLSDFEEADQLIGHLLSKAPDMADAWGVAADHARALGHDVRRLQYLERALSLNPGSQSLAVAYAETLLGLNSFARAHEVIEQLKQRWPLDATVELLRAQLFEGVGEVEKARSAYEEAERISDFDALFVNRANFERHAGQLQSARRYFDRALELNPRNVEAFLGLSQLALSLEGTLNYLNQAKHILDEQIGSPSRKANLQYALGAFCDRAGLYDSAFAYYLEANSIRAKQHPYEPTQDETLYDKVRRFTDERKKGEDGLLVAEDRKPIPVFIVGLPRSGSTLLEQIIGSCDRVTLLGEEEFLNRALAEWATQEFSATQSDTELQKIFEVYQQLLDGRSQGRKFTVDKQLLNHRWVPLICESLPHARIIWIDKDPLSAVWSLFKQQFRGYSYSYDLASLDLFYRLYKKHREWVKATCGSAVYFLSFEDLAADTTKTTADLASFLGLSSLSELSYEGSGKFISTISSSQVREAVNPEAATAWRIYEAKILEVCPNFATI